MWVCVFLPAQGTSFVVLGGDGGASGPAAPHPRGAVGCYTTEHPENLHRDSISQSAGWALKVYHK